MPPPVRVEDTFVETSGDVSMGSHTPTGTTPGAGWVAGQAGSPAALVRDATDDVRDDNTVSGNRMVMNNDLLNDEMNVEADIRFENPIAGDLLFAGVMGRRSGASNVGYEFTYNWADGAWNLIGAGSGGSDQEVEAFPGGTVRMKLTIRDSDVRGFVDGVEKVQLTTNVGTGNNYAGMILGNFTGDSSKRSVADNFLALDPFATPTPATIATTTTIGTPTLSAGSTVSATTISTTTSLPAPTLATSATHTATTISTTTTIPTPTISAGSTVGATTIATSTTLPAPTITIGAGVTPATISAPTTIGVPSFTSSATPTPATISIPTTLPVPSVVVGGDASVAVATIATTTSLSAPTVSTSTTTAPATIQTSTTLPPPTLLTESNATITPATINATTTLPTPTVTNQATPSPATIALTTTLDPPTILLTQIATPATIHLTTTLPAPTILNLVRATSRRGCVVPTAVSRRSCPETETEDATVMVETIMTTGE